MTDLIPSMRDLSRDAAFDKLLKTIRENSSSSELSQDLRSLRRAGLSWEDIRIGIEVERAKNTMGDRSMMVEENCLSCLDMITGIEPGLDLSDAAECAALIRPLWPSEEPLGLVERGLEASDLLPMDHAAPLSREHGSKIFLALSEYIGIDQYRPRKAYFTRAPKQRFTTRPAASLHILDRVVYQFLADRVGEAAAKNELPEVLWPVPGGDSRSALRKFRSFDSQISEGNRLAKTDIESFFEYVDHSLLAHILQAYYFLDSRVARSVETFLNAVMGSPRGLPQGPKASDMFASAYLTPLDYGMHHGGWKFVRFQDDYKIECESIGDAKQTIRNLENSMMEIGLRLAAEKTYFTKAVAAPPPGSDFEDGDPYSIENAQTRVTEMPIPDRHNDRLERELQSLEFLRRPTSSSNVSAEQPPTDRKARNILTRLSATKSGRLTREQLTAVLDFFPHLAPEVAQYLAVRYVDHPAEVWKFIKFRTVERRELDWENAWLIMSLPLSKRELTGGSVQFLLQTMMDHAVPPLTRCVAARTLIRNDYLASDAWTAVDDIDESLKSELRLAAYVPGGPILQQR